MIKPEFELKPFLKTLAGVTILTVAQYFLILKNIVKYNKNKV